VSDLTPLSFGGCRFLKHLFLDGNPLQSVTVTNTTAAAAVATSNGFSTDRVGAGGAGAGAGALPFLETLHLGRTKVERMKKENEPHTKNDRYTLHEKKKHRITENANRP
jgi:hypothetical protein